MSEQKRRVQIFIPPELFDEWKACADAKSLPLSSWVIGCIQNSRTIAPTIGEMSRKLDAMAEAQRLTHSSLYGKFPTEPEGDFCACADEDCTGDHR